VISIVERSSLDEDGYNCLLLQVKPQPIYTNLKFIDAIASYTDSKAFFVLKSESGRIKAALPFSIYSGVYGRVINSLPFYGSHGGITALEKSYIQSKEMIDALLEYAESVDSVAVTVIEPLFNRDSQEIFKDFDYRDSRIGMLNEVDCNGNVESIMASFSPRARNSVRKAMQSGLKVVESQSPESIEFLARIHFENMTSAGRKAKSKNFFTEFLSQIPEDNWVIIEAHLEGERVASLLLIFTSDVIEYFTPVTLTVYKQLQPLSLLILHGFLFATKKKIRYWNWGGTWTNQEGVYKFKKQWNPIESTYFRYTKILRQTILDIDTPTLMSAYPHYYVYPINQIDVSEGIKSK
jgi:hypothetical protein